MKFTAFVTTPLALVLSLCTPQAAPDVSRLPCNQWATTALDAGWQPNELPQLLNTMWRESRCQPDAVRRNSRGGTVDVGLMQINQVHRPDLERRGFSHADMTDPAANLWYARVLHQWHTTRGLCGWAPWRGKC